MLISLAAGVAPADLLLLMAASENDAPKVAELLRAGADTSAKVGRQCNTQVCLTDHTSQ